jgi:hypothetical protein
MIGGQEQHQLLLVPADLGEEGRVNTVSPPTGLGIDETLTEHMLTPHRRASNDTDRCRAHRSASASSRGLDTRSVLWQATNAATLTSSPP